MSEISASTVNSRAVSSVNAVSERADNGQGTTSLDTTGSAAGIAAASGASSRIRCALVPLIPNDDTPARRGRPPVSHGRDDDSNCTAPVDQSTCGDGLST